MPAPIARSSLSSRVRDITFASLQVPVAYQRKVRAVSKLVTGLDYFVKKAMSSFLKKHLHDAWMVGTGGKEAKYTEAFMQLSQEEQRINARDRRFYK